MRNTRRARLVLTILLLAAFTLITIDYRSGALGGVRRTAATVFGPIEDALSDITHPIGSWFSSIGHLNSYRHENEALKSEVARLQSQLHLTAAERAELAQDEQILHLASVAQFRVVAARVIAIGSGLGTDQTVTIDRGSANGIRVNETVITGAGLVGRTIVVGRTVSTVLLANDPTSFVGARLEGKQLELGTVQGGGLNHPMSLTLYSSTAQLTVGEQLVTAGDSQNHNSPFVPEVPIGTVSRVLPLQGGLAQMANVQPFVDYSALDVVAVVVHAPKTVKHDSLLPAPPTPAPTVTVTVTTTPGAPTSGSSSTTSGTPSNTGTASSTP
jgi:rod shape-determining protein MreC